MAVIANSNQYATQTTINRTGISSGVRCLYFEGATATADVGTINLIRLPPGRMRILPKLSGFLCADMDADANISIGTAAYTATNGATVVADVDALKTLALVNTCVLANARTIMQQPANGGLLVDSLDGVTITATVVSANTVAANTFSGWIAYSYLG